MSRLSDMPGAQKLIAKYKRGERITSLEVGELLAVIKRAHEAFGEHDANGELVDVQIPFPLLDMIGFAVMGRTNLQRAGARKRKGRKFAPHHADWQAEADEIWRKNPRLTKHRVAILVSRKTAGEANWIPRKISKTR